MGSSKLLKKSVRFAEISSMDLPVSETCSNCEIFNTGRSMELISANLTLFFNSFELCGGQTVSSQWGGARLFAASEGHPHENGCNSETKSRKWIQRCQIDRLREGYKRAIDKIRGPIAKNRLSGQNPKILVKKNVTLLDSS